MNVLHLGPFPPPYGGVQTNLVAIRNYLRSRGFGCGVINLTRYRRKDSDGVYYPGTPWETLSRILTIPHEIAHIHFCGNLNPRTTLVALLCTFLPGKKTVMTFHSGGYPSSPEGRAVRPNSLLGFTLRRLSALIAVNREIVDFFIRLGVAPERIHLIGPHAVDTSSMGSVPPPLERFFDEHNPVLLSVGGLEPEYDIAFQIDAMEDLKARFPEIGLIVAGSGSLEKDLKSYVSTRPYASSIVLYGDMPHPVTLAAIDQCSVFLRTTLYDGDSVAVREALHLGAPVIATDNKMRPAGVHLIPISDRAAFVEAVEKAISMPRASRGDSGEENLKKVVEVYLSLLPGSAEQCAIS